MIYQNIRRHINTLLHLNPTYLVAVPVAFLLAGTAAMPANATSVHSASSLHTQYFTTGSQSIPTEGRDTVDTYLPALDTAKNSGWPAPDSIPDVFLDALSLIGTPYIVGGNSPSTGFGCSSFTKYVWGLHGVDLINSARSQMEHGKIISESEARLGDLIYMPGHVGFWAGHGWILDAPKPGGYVNIRPLWTNNITIFRVTA
jgi:cell wall-associated NlpC family hydrolase